jgi:uncharacterized YigZ family protein
MSTPLDTYHTIAASSTGEFRDRGSRFFAYAFPADTEDSCHEALSQVRKEHSKARHHCYAYRLGMDNNQYRANDDGEPGGTAGRPILGQIDSFGLTNTIVIVVRYFGGTLLGTSGLINAYKTAAAAALSQADIIEKTIEDIYTLRFDYAIMSKVMNAVKQLSLEMMEQDFGHTAALKVAIRQSEVADKLLRLKALVAGVYLEEAEALEEIEGFELEYERTR